MGREMGSGNGIKAEKNPSGGRGLSFLFLHIVTRSIKARRNSKEVPIWKIVYHSKA